MDGVTVQLYELLAPWAPLGAAGRRLYDIYYIFGRNFCEQPIVVVVAVVVVVTLGPAASSILNRLTENINLL